MQKAKENVSVWMVIDQSKKARLSSKKLYSGAQSNVWYRHINSVQQILTKFTLSFADFLRTSRTITLVGCGPCRDQYPLGPIHGWTSPGYEKAKKGQICVDVNECMEKTPCNYNERCINLDGFYKCLKTSQAGTRNTIFSRTILTHSN